MRAVKVIRKSRTGSKRSKNRQSTVQQSSLAPADAAQKSPKLLGNGASLSQSGHQPNGVSAAKAPNAASQGSVSGKPQTALQSSVSSKPQAGHAEKPSWDAADKAAAPDFVHLEGVGAAHVEAVTVDVREMVMNEWELQKVGHGHMNICQAYALYEDSAHLYLIMEHCAAGTIIQALAKSQGLNEAHVMGYIKQTLHAVHFLHGHGIAHRDLKTVNIMMVYTPHAMSLPESKRRLASHFVVRLIDFGLAARLCDPAAVVAQLKAANMWPIHPKRRSLSAQGTPSLKPAAAPPQSPHVAHLQQLSLEGSGQHTQAERPQLQNILDSLLQGEAVRTREGAPVTTVDFSNDPLSAKQEPLAKVAEAATAALLDATPSAKGAGLKIKPLSVLAGSPPYMSYEMLRGAYGLQTDMWSLGVCVYRLLLGSFPFDGTKTEIWTQVLTGDEPSYTPSRGFVKPSATAVDFCRQLLRRNPLDRLNVRAALEHPSIRDRPTPTNVRGEYTSLAYEPDPAEAAVSVDRAVLGGELRGNEQKTGEPSLGLESSSVANSLRSGEVPVWERSANAESDSESVPSFLRPEYLAQLAKPNQQQERMLATLERANAQGAKPSSQRALQAGSKSPVNSENGAFADFFGGVAEWMLGYNESEDAASPRGSEGSDARDDRDDGLVSPRRTQASVELPIDLAKSSKELTTGGTERDASGEAPASNEAHDAHEGAIRRFASQTSNSPLKFRTVAPRLEVSGLPEVAAKTLLTRQSVTYDDRVYLMRMREGLLHARGRGGSIGTPGASFAEPRKEFGTPQPRKGANLHVGKSPVADPQAGFLHPDFTPPAFPVMLGSAPPAPGMPVSFGMQLADANAKSGET